jgi:hypothetical protein
MNITVATAEQALSLVQATRGILARPSAFTKGAMARSSRKWDVAATSEDATCWCTVGAMRSALGNNSALDPGYLLAKDAITTAFGGEGLSDVMTLNDKPRTTQAQVVNTLDFAVLIAKDQLKAAKQAAK